MRRRNAHAQADAQRAVNLPCVRARQVVQHVGEECDALFCPGIVDVLGQKIVQIKSARAAFVIDDLQQAEIRVAAETLDELRRMAGAVAADAGESEQQTRERAHDHRRFVAGLMFPDKIMAAGHQHQQDRGEIHRPGIGEKGNQQVADEHRADETPQRADGGEPPDVSADAVDGAGEHANEKRPDHRQQ